MKVTKQIANLKKIVAKQHRQMQLAKVHPVNGRLVASDGRILVKVDPFGDAPTAPFDPSFLRIGQSISQDGDNLRCTDSKGMVQLVPTEATDPLPSVDSCWPTGEARIAISIDAKLLATLSASVSGVSRIVLEIPESSIKGGRVTGPLRVKDYDLSDSEGIIMPLQPHKD